MPIRTSPKTSKLNDEQILGCTRSGDKGCVYYCATLMLYSGYRYFPHLIDFSLALRIIPIYLCG